MRKYKYLGTIVNEINECMKELAKLEVYSMKCERYSVEKISLYKMWMYRIILKIKWVDQVPNTEVLKIKSK